MKAIWLLGEGRYGVTVLELFRIGKESAMLPRRDIHNMNLRIAGRIPLVGLYLHPNQVFKSGNHEGNIFIPHPQGSSPSSVQIGETQRHRMAHLFNINQLFTV